MAFDERYAIAGRLLGRPFIPDDLLPVDARSHWCQGGGTYVCEVVRRFIPDVNASEACFDCVDNSVHGEVTTKYEMTKPFVHRIDHPACDMPYGAC